VPSVLVVLFAVVLPIVLWSGLAALEFVSPLANWIDGAFLLNLFIVLCCGAVALWRRRWPTAVLSAIPFLLLILMNLFEVEAGDFVARLGFRALALSDPSYLARCRLVVFEESGKTQQLGVCNALPHAGITTVVIYDSSGELCLPVEQRSQAWKDAAETAWESTALSAARCWPIYGNFYSVVVSRDE